MSNQSPLPPPPPLPHNQAAPQPAPVADGRTGSLFGSLASRGKAAAQLVAKQTERTKLANVNLPAAHHALGKHLHDSGRLRGNLPDQYQAADKLLGEIRAIESRATGRPSAEGIAAKAKALAKSTADMAQTKALQVRLNHALGELGKAAFDRFGDQAGPAELTRPIADLRSRLASLDADIAALSTAAPGQIITPKRIAVAGGASVVTIALLIAWSFMGGSKSPTPSSGSNNVATPSKSAEKAHGMELPELLKKCVALAESDPDGAASLLQLHMITMGQEEELSLAMADLPPEDQKKLADVKRRAKEMWQKRRAENRADNEAIEARGGVSRFDADKDAQGQDDGGTTAGRQHITEDEVKDLDLEQLQERLGAPSEVYTSPKRHNVKLYTWKLGGDKLVILGVIHRIDGVPGYVTMEGAKVIPTSRLDRVKRGIDGALSGQQ